MFTVATVGNKIYFSMPEQMQLYNCSRIPGRFTADCTNIMKLPLYQRVQRSIQLEQPISFRTQIADNRFCFSEFCIGLGDNIAWSSYAKDDTKKKVMIIILQHDRHPIFPDQILEDVKKKRVMRCVQTIHMANVLCPHFAFHVGCNTCFFTVLRISYCCEPMTFFSFDPGHGSRSERRFYSVFYT